MRLGGMRPGVIVTLALVAAFAIVIVRVSMESRAELVTATTHHREGRSELAALHYRRAIRWALPLSPSRAGALSGLEALATELEEAGDTTGALLAWRSLSGGIASGRAIYRRPSEARKRANEAIARLVAAGPRLGIDASLSAEQVAADHVRLLNEDVSPDRFWGVLLLAGMAVWIIALFFVAQRGFDSSGRLTWTAARGPFWTALAGLGSFVLGLLFA